MNKIIGNPYDGDSYIETVKFLDEVTKIRIYDFSLKVSRSNIITVKILRKINEEWEEIGKALIVIENLKKAKWADTIIGSNSEFHYIGSISIPNRRYNYRTLRNQGIGGKVVDYMLDYLKRHGVKIVHGEISSRDNYEIASNFWKKHNFIIKKYKKPKGVMVAKIFCML